jgi:protein FAM50
MGLQGYVGSAEDQRRIRRQEKEREERRKEFEQKKQQSDANVDAAGFRKFGAGTSEALSAFPLLHSFSEARGH